MQIQRRATVSTVEKQTSQKRVVIANTAAKTIGVGTLLFLSLSALGGIYNPVDQSRAGEWWPGGAFLAIPALLAIRGTVVGVVVDGDVVRSRGWLRTETFRREGVTGVRTVPYSGFWNQGRRSRHLRMLALTMSHAEIKVPAVVARREKAESLANQLRAALDLAAAP